MSEVWKEIPGYEGRYAASDLGRIKSLARTVRIGKFFRQIQETILKEKPTHYPQVQLSQKEYLIHRLVALTFIPNPENHKTVNHKDGNRHNNSVSNLEWCSQLENNLHAIRNGKKVPTGDLHYRRNRSYNKETKAWV